MYPSVINQLMNGQKLVLYKNILNFFLQFIFDLAFSMSTSFTMDVLFVYLNAFDPQRSFLPIPGKTALIWGWVNIVEMGWRNNLQKTQWVITNLTRFMTSFQWYLHVEIRVKNKKCKTSGIVGAMATKDPGLRRLGRWHVLNISRPCKNTGVIL